MMDENESMQQQQSRESQQDEEEDDEQFYDYDDDIDINESDVEILEKYNTNQDEQELEDQLKQEETKPQKPKKTVVEHDDLELIRNDNHVNGFLPQSSASRPFEPEYFDTIGFCTNSRFTLVYPPSDTIQLVWIIYLSQF